MKTYKEAKKDLERQVIVFLIAHAITIRSMLYKIDNIEAKDFDIKISNELLKQPTDRSALIDVLAHAEVFISQSEAIT